MEQSIPVAAIAVSTQDRRSIFVRIAWMTGFALLTAAGAQVEIPLLPVPITLQTFVVLLSGAVLGARYGAMSQALYLCAGIAGLPVFAGWSAGLLRVLGPTGGYLLSFPLAAMVTGVIAGRSRSYGWILIAAASGSLVTFFLGTIQLKLVYTHDWSDAFTQGFLIFSWWDAVKIIAAASIARAIRPRPV